MWLKGVLLTLINQCPQLHHVLSDLRLHVAVLYTEQCFPTLAGRGANEELKGQVLQLTGWLAQEQERRDSMVSCVWLNC